MSTDILKNVVFLAGLSLATVWAVSNKDMIYEKTGLTAKMQDKQAERAQEIREQREVNLTPTVTQGTVAIKKANDGQFWTQGQVNNRPIKFLIDTGASSVALTMEDAKRVGVKTKQLDYNVPISTAGGKLMAAYVGMTYLGEIRKIEVTPKALILKN